MNIYIKILVVGLLLVVAGESLAQKRALDSAAYKLWRRVDAQDMSCNGQWVTYQYVHIDRDNTPKIPVTYLYNTFKKKTYELPGVSRPSFFNNGRWLRYTVESPGEKEETRDSVFLLNLQTMKRLHWNREYDFNESGSSEWVTYTYSIGKKENGFKRWVAWDIERGDTISVDSVESPQFREKDRSVLYLKNHGTYKSLCYRASSKKAIMIYGDSLAPIKEYSLRGDESMGTFIVASDTSKLKQPNLLYSFSLKDGTCKFLLDLEQIGLPEEYAWRSRAYRLSNDGQRLIIDVEPKNNIPREKKEKKKFGFELELWTWNDEVSSLQQREGNYNPCNIKFAYDLKCKACYQITTQEMEKLILPACDQYDYAFAIDRSPYKRLADWKSDINGDLYLINMNTGETVLFEKNAYREPEWSPDGKYALWYDALEKAWYKINPATGERANISKAIGHPVHNELHDLPKPAEAYGIAGWTLDGENVVLYDNYDMWVINLAGKKETYSLTKGEGRATGRRFRRVKEDYGDKKINIQSEILLHSVDLRAKDEGIYRLSPGGKLKKLVEGPYSLAINQLSGGQKYCIFTRQSYTEFRDLWWSDLNFTRPERITETNPQQKDYFWGMARLFRWINGEGKENAGILYLPENYDPSKRYPVIVNFYETHTEGFHVYPLPGWSSGMLNVVDYVSKGYVVFMPDVHFTVGTPGESSYHAVVSGTQALIDQGIADKDRIGIQGHSWSGYQVAYLVTRTDIFACASPGAAVSNMVSAYTGIRTGSGMPRMFMYEETQSRLGKSLWEDKEMYLRHSPILDADKIQTPLLIFHCDADEAVPYSEGLNLFLAMRRLQKPAWLLNYKGERHFLFNKAAEIDWSIRLEQFFDHYLKGKPMPRWMKEGIHAREREYDLKYDY